MFLRQEAIVVGVPDYAEWRRIPVSDRVIGEGCLKILMLLLASLIFNSPANVCVNHYL